MLLSLIAAINPLQEAIHQNAVAITSPTELGQPAKRALQKAIGKKRVVMLGELTHGDGTTFQLKDQLIRFLHQEMGFNVLVWESGLYECEIMNRTPAQDANSWARMAVFSHWSNGKESLPVFEFALKEPRKLQMAGFDLQESGRASNTLFEEAAGWFDSPDPAQQALRAKVLAAVDVVRKGRKDPASDEIKALRATAEGLHAYAQENAKTLRKQWGKEAEFRLRTVENMAANAKLAQLYLSNEVTKSYNLRERQNADNLEWLLTKRFPKEKLIVWAHNVHIYKGLATGALQSTGQIFAQKRAKDTYVLGFLGKGGAWSWLGNPPIPFTPPEPDHLESQFPEKLSFLDLAAFPKDHPIQAPIPGRMNRQSDEVAKISWPKGFDGLIYLPVMSPRTSLPPK